jgi:hypothetical protein
VSAELLPCPFCGRVPKLEESRDTGPGIWLRPQPWPAQKRIAQIRCCNTLIYRSIDVRENNEERAREFARELATGEWNHRAPVPAAAPEPLQDWKLVPVKLTEAMRATLTTMLTDCHTLDESYSDLLTAAQHPSEAKNAGGLTHWEEGVLMAASVLIGCHDQPSMAANILNELGVRTANCSGMDEFDKANLQKIEGERFGIALRGLAAAPVGGA